MSNLMLHCGSEAIDRNGLAEVIPGDAMGSRHFPVPYIDYVEQVADNLQLAGYKIDDELFGVQKDGGQFFGLMEISPAIEGEYIPAGEERNEFGLTVGLRGAYDQSLARGLAIGSRVFVCDNLAFSGEVTFKTRQTLRIQERLPEMIEHSIGQLIDMSELQNRRFDAYKNTAFKPRWGDAAIVECVRRGIVNPSQVGKVVAEWDNPSHDEHGEHGYSVWRYHNAITEAIKPVNGRAAVLPNQERTIKLTKFLDDVVGL